MDCFDCIPEKKKMVFSVMSLLLSYSQKPVKKSREELRREKQEEEKRLYEVSETSTAIQNSYKSLNLDHPDTKTGGSQNNEQFGLGLYHLHWKFPHGIIMF